MKDLFMPLSSGKVRLCGPLGKALDNVLERRLKKMDYRRLVDPFRFRNEIDNRWRCEFWGKNLRAGVYAWRSTRDPELRAILDQTVADILSTQTADGCISSYPEEKQLGGWDVWGRKYVLLGLLAYDREVNPNPEVMTAMLRMTEHLLKQAAKIQDCGDHYGMAASSILRALVELHQLSGSQTILDAARKLAEIGCCHLHNIFDMAWKGIPPAELSDGKAYEMTSCFHGLAALYRVDENPRFKETVLRYYEMVRDREIFITGCGGLKDANGEIWYNGKTRQIRHDCGGMGETCVAVSWLGFCENLLRMTGDSRVADEMERSFYNALLGAVTPDGTNNTHINPYLDGGWKKPAADQMTGFPGQDCCRAQGPYGLSLAPMIAVMKSEAGYAVNLYEDLTASDVLEINGNFPASDTVTITLERDGDFELALRIPGEFGCEVDGTPVCGGTYHRIRRIWKWGDVIRLRFDFTVRTVPCGDFSAKMCGPLVLCRESGGDPESLPLRRIEDMVDYASAGLRFSPENTLRVWNSNSACISE